MQHGSVRNIRRPIAVIAGMLVAASVHAVEPLRPNIVFILADDLGYGDIGCLNRDHGKIKTPCLDRIAHEGISFTEAHSSSAVCTPTRYGIITGRYNWRSPLQQFVLLPYDKRVLIQPDRLTMPRLLRDNDYATAAFGKWHLGFTWPKKGGTYDFTQRISGGPLSVGFDTYFGVDAPNYPPFCFIDGDRTLGIPDVLFQDEQLRTRRDPGWLSTPGWRLEGIQPTLTGKVCDYISRQAKEDRPFFLYYAMTAPHTPIVPGPEWRGRSGLNAYADFVMETDAMVGRVMETLEKAGVADRTLVIVTSDNGCSHRADIGELESKGHFPSGDRRGIKGDLWDGGHRIPCLARWPGHIRAGAETGRLICLNDWMATFADIIRAKIPDNAAEDSVSLLPLLRGDDQPVRDHVVHHSTAGMFSIRTAEWKLLLCAGSGGSSPGTTTNPQLYEVTADKSEQNNRASAHPEIVAMLQAKLEKIVADGRSTAGVPQKNDVVVTIYKKDQASGHGAE